MRTRTRTRRRRRRSPSHATATTTARGIGRRWRRLWSTRVGTRTLHRRRRVGRRAVVGIGQGRPVGRAARPPTAADSEQREATRMDRVGRNGACHHSGVIRSQHSGMIRTRTRTRTRAHSSSSSSSIVRHHRLVGCVSPVQREREAIWMDDREGGTGGCLRYGHRGSGGERGSG